MAGPMLQVERAVKELEEKVARHELVISMMMTRVGFSEEEIAGLEKTLQGEEEHASEEPSAA